MRYGKFAIAALYTVCALAAGAEPLAPIKIGWVGPLTGNSAVVGVDAVPAIQIEFDRINAAGGIKGRRLELLVEDDAYQTQKSLSAYEKLVHIDKVPFIFMSTYGAMFATAQQAVRDNVLVLDTLDCNEDLAALPRNSLCLATKTETIASGFADHILGIPNQRVLILVEESDGWMQLIARHTRELLERGGAQVLEESTLPSASDYKQNLLRAKNRQVQAFVILGNDQMGLALKQMQQLGMRGQIYGVGSILSPGFQALAGTAIEGALVSSWLAPQTSALKEFNKLFRSRHGRGPLLELATIPAFDAAGWLVACLPEALEEKGTVEPEKLRSCLFRAKGFEGLSGKLVFDSDGAVRSIAERLFRFRDGELVELSDGEPPAH